ncbi:MAG: T9SS C-terminal target domain-containing protein, partial [Calditrichaeota bacterium]
NIGSKGRMMLFGGRYADTNYFNDCYLLDLSLGYECWTKLSFKSCPSGRYGQSMIFSPQDNQTILFGGYDGKNYLNDTWIFNTSSTDPVELLSFSGTFTGNVIKLNWSTATETNNLGFEIQRSIDQVKFDVIGFVNGNGTTSAAKNYIFIDRDFNQGIYYYRLKQIDFDGSYYFSDLIQVVINIPEEFTLQQNYPNPFNVSTTLKYQLPKESEVRMNVYDTRGRLVEALFAGRQAAGYYHYIWSGCNLPSGVYAIRLEAGGQQAIRKCILIK